MVLSDQDIKESVDHGLISIVPFQLDKSRPATYIFTLGINLLRPVGNDLIDFRKKILPEYEEISLTDEGYILNSGEFLLAQTREKLTLSPQISMILEGLSALARIGIQVVQTSGFIEPDHTGSIITLELKNNGKSPFLLYPEMKIAKGIFMKLSSPASFKFTNSSYITQEKVEPPKVEGGGFCKGYLVF